MNAHYKGEWTTPARDESAQPAMPPAVPPALPKAGSPIRIEILVLIYQAVFLAWIHWVSARNGSPGKLDVEYVVGTLVSVYLAGRLLGLILDRFRGRQDWVLMPFFFGYTLLNLYQLRTSTQLDPALLADHWRHLDRGNVARVIMVSLGPWDIFLCAGIAVLAGAWVTFFGEFEVRKWSGRKLTFGCAAYLGINAMVPAGGEQFGSFASRTLLYLGRHRSTSVLKPRVANSEPQWPYYHTNQLFARLLGSNEPPPNVVLLTLESFARGYVERTTPDGREYTPNLNRLIGRGLYAECHFANAAYTIKSQESILGGFLPTATGEANHYWEGRRVLGLPKLLGQHGYFTVFMSGHNDLKFANTDQVMRSLGFAQIIASDQLARPSDRDFFWGWGLQDDHFYEVAFAEMDSILSRAGSRPVFLNLASISHHIPFEVPQAERGLYPAPKNKREVFANSINAADRYLKRFVEEWEKRPGCRNSLLIVTGDHGYPSGEHSIYLNNVFAYNELFSVPFLLVWPDKIKPGRLRQPTSHIDIAPTILDLLNLSVPNHFAGKSLFDPAQLQELHPVVQTYDGGYVGIIDYPWKYLSHLESGRNFLYDLASDQNETVNLIDSPSQTARIARLHAEAAKVLDVQRIIATDRLLPPSPQASLR